MDNNIHIGFLLLASLCLGIAFIQCVVNLVQAVRARKCVLNQAFALIAILLAAATTTGLAYILSLVPTSN